MKKQLMFLMILNALNISAQYDFRKTIWGMTKDQVINSESLELKQDQKNFLGYQGQVADFDCLIAYIFAYDTLVRARYMIIEEHSNENDFIRDWDKIKEILINKYGNPSNGEINWLNDLYKDDYQQWGFAVSLGHLQYLSEWENDNTKILNVLQGDNYEINHIIEYVSLEYKPLEEKYQQSQRESEF